jgi:cupin fold WbuC family metalloprotein
MEIFSKQKILVAKIFFFKNLKKKRDDVCPSNEFIQLSAQVLDKSSKVKAHSHLNIHRVSNITQEIWLVFSGKIEASIFDLNKKIIKKVRLQRGDCLILFIGRHGFKNLSKRTIFYEIKTGPYYGKDKDTAEIVNGI